MSTGHGKWVTREQAAKMLGVTIPTIYYHKRENGLVIKRGLVEWGSLVALGRKLRPSEEWDQNNGVRNDTTSLVVKPPGGALDDTVRDLSSRVSAVESLFGISQRGTGLNRMFLLGLSERAIKASRVKNLLDDEEERMRWIQTIEQFDLESVRMCLKDPALSELINWLVRLGNRIHDVSNDVIEKAKALSSVKNLRYLCQQVSPPGPLINCKFKLFGELSPLESFVIACHYGP